MYKTDYRINIVNALNIYGIYVFTKSEKMS